MSWQINDHRKVAPYYEPFGDALLTIAHELRSIDADLEHLRRAARSMSVPIHRILMDRHPLLRCVRRPALPPLVDPRTLVGDPIELVKPTAFTIYPPEEPGYGTGVAMRFAAHAFPLYGWRYNAVANQYSVSDPWDRKAATLRLDRWLKQNVVQVNLDTYTIRETISLVRNSRGAHSDREYPKDTPAPLASYHEFYLDMLMILVGRLLVDTAATVATVSEIKDNLFPGVSNPSKELAYSFPATARTPHKPARFSFNPSEGIPAGHEPYSPETRMTISTALWCLGAPDLPGFRFPDFPPVKQRSYHYEFAPEAREHVPDRIGGTTDSPPEPGSRVDVRPASHEDAYEPKGFEFYVVSVEKPVILVGIRPSEV